MFDLIPHVHPISSECAAAATAAAPAKHHHLLTDNNNNICRHVCGRTTNNDLVSMHTNPLRCVVVSLSLCRAVRAHYAPADGFPMQIGSRSGYNFKPTHSLMSAFQHVHYMPCAYVDVCAREWYSQIAMYRRLPIRMRNTLTHSAGLIMCDDLRRPGGYSACWLLLTGQMTENLRQRGNGQAGRQSGGQQHRRDAGTDAGSGGRTAYEEHVQKAGQTLERRRTASGTRRWIWAENVRALVRVWIYIFP